MTKRLAAVALAAALALPASASAALVTQLPKDFAFGLTAALRDHGQAVDFAASTLGPSYLWLSCDAASIFEIEQIGSLDKPTKLHCDSKPKRVGYFFFPGISGVRATLLFVSGNYKPVPVHATLRTVGEGGDVDDEGVTVGVSPRR